VSEVFNYHTRVMVGYFRVMSILIANSCYLVQFVTMERVRVEPESMNEHRIKTNPPQVMSVVEASIYAGLSERMMRELVKDNKIKHSRVGGRILIRKSRIDELLARSES